MLFKIYTLFVKSFQIWGEAKASRMSAALAYYTMLSLSPILILAIAIAGSFFSEEEIASAILGLVGNWTSQQVVQQVGELIQNDAVAVTIERTTARESGLIAGGISILILLFGASSVFTQLQDTLNIMWNVPYEQRSGILYTLIQRGLGILIVLSMGILLVFRMLLTTVLAYFSDLVTRIYAPALPLMSYAEQGITLLIMPVFFALLFWFLPNVDVRWRYAIPAGILTAGLFAGSRTLIALYLSLSSTSAVYGAASSLVVMLTWIYLIGLIFFFGAAFSRAYAEVFGDFQ